MSADTLFELPTPANPAPAGAALTSAVLSADDTYRYRLTRRWDLTLPSAVFVMLNPSTADDTLDDPTIRRCCGFARTWGYGGIDVVNLYAYRATQPADMLAAADPVGPDNDEHLTEAARYAQTRGVPLVAAWGNNARPDRVAQVLALPGMDHLVCLGVTLSGAPKHPLARGHHRIPNDVTPTPWPTAAQEPRP